MLFRSALTYEKYQRVYRRHYSADNCCITLYGKMDMAEKLAFLDEHYLSRMPKGTSRPRLTVQDQQNGVRVHIPYYTENPEPDQVPFVLRLVGLMTKASCYPEELSGGEQQRVALARALTNNANLIIADEPTGNIDPTMSYEVVKLLTCLNEMGTTIVMVTHEHELVRAFDRRVITLGNGCIVGDTAAQAPQEPDVPQPIEPLSDAVQAGGAL